MPPQDRVSIDLEVSPPEAEVMVIGIAPEGEELQKGGFAPRSIAPGRYQVNLLRGPDYQVVAKAPGFHPDILPITVQPGESPPDKLSISLSPTDMPSGTGEPITPADASILRIGVEQVQFEGDPLSPFEMADLRYRIRKAVKDYFLNDKVRGLEVLSDGALDRFLKGKQAFSENMAQQTAMAVEARLQGLINGPDVVVSVTGIAKRSPSDPTAPIEIGLSAEVWRALSGLLVGSKYVPSGLTSEARAALGEILGDPATAGELERKLADRNKAIAGFDGVGKSMAPAESVAAGAISDADILSATARRLARQVVYRLHQLYPTRVFPEDLPKEYDAVLLRIGEREVGGYPVYLEHEPGDKHQLLDWLDPPTQEPPTLPGLTERAKVIAERSRKILLCEFSVTPDFVSELDNREVPAGLRDQLQSHNRDLTPLAQVKVDQPKSNWTIDDDVKYSIRCEDLSVYVSEVLTVNDNFLRDYGQALYKWIGPLAGEQLHNAWEKAQANRTGLRLRLCCDSPELQTLPWEYLFVPWLDDVPTPPHIGQRTDLVFSRYLPPPAADQVPIPAEGPSPLEGPLRTLVLIPTPSGLEVNAKLEAESIQGALNEAGSFRAEEEIRQIVPTILQGDGATWDEALDGALDGPWLKSIRPSAFHFIGHGEVDLSDGKVMLVGTKRDPQGQLIDSYKCAGDLLKLFGSSARELRLVLLQSCASGSADPKLLGVGRDLAAFVPVVVAMQHTIGIQRAKRFAHVFYLDLALGHEVDIAAAEGRRAIARDMCDERDWGTPVVYMQRTGLLGELPIFNPKA